MLTDTDRAIYEWQIWVPGFGDAGQQALKKSTVLVSRVGGVGGAAAYHLACAGVGKLILAHGGALRLNDLNRQILMARDGIGKPRVQVAAKRLRELNPDLEIEAIDENISEENAAQLVARADLIVDCAPLFAERFLMNREAVRQRKPMVDCAMYELEARITSILPGKTPCLACLHPSEPAAWKRQFPVFGAVAGTIGCMGAMEAIKILSGLGEPLYSRMAVCDFRSMNFRTLKIARNPGCAVCASA
ncbi:MAG TPA: HesA/MoeB/ThiF family protein [Planctomycetota bacterium]|nr:HesA/MoeB/ThiF family protein [Planctomycetota bacterium]